VGTLASALAFAVVGGTVIVFRDRFIEWVANRNAKFGLTIRHDRVARFTAWFIGVTFLAVAFVELVIVIQH
jgi:hypothetical protein